MVWKAKHALPKILVGRVGHSGNAPRVLGRKWERCVLVRSGFCENWFLGVTKTHLSKIQEHTLLVRPI